MQWPERVCVRLDPDVREMLNHSAKTVTWGSQGHPINACLRKGLRKKFTPPGLRVAENPFDQLAIDVMPRKARKP